MSEYQYEQELDSHEARMDFENVLKGILDKANAGESFGSTAVLSGAEDEKESVNEGSIKGLSTPTKHSRKRKRKEETKENKLKNSFVMKLFDRSVDLGLFSEDTPLYPICRSWMENDPNGKKKEDDNYNGVKYSSNTEDENTEGSEDEEIPLAEMPQANMPWSNFDINGQYISPRIPSPIPQPNDSLDNYLGNEVESPSAENLLVNHLHRWKNIRTKWKAKSIENEARYADGMQLLSNMFNRHLYNGASQ